MKKSSLCVILIALLSLAPITLSPRTATAETGEINPTNHQPAVIVLGQPDFTSSVASTSPTRMNLPHAVTVDPTTGKVFVADMNNHRVLRFASAAALSSGAAAEAVLGQAEFDLNLPNRGGAAAANTLNRPLGVSVDSAGRLWVADASNNRVLRFDVASAKTNGAIADGVLGQEDFSGSAPALSPDRMNQSNDVFVDSEGQLWVSDFNNNRVLRFKDAASKNNGDPTDGVLGQPNFTTSDPATTQDGMHYPAGLFVDLDGRLWVAEYGNNRLLRFENAAGKQIGALADGVLGQVDFFHNGADCTPNGMSIPRGVERGSFRPAVRLR